MPTTRRLIMVLLFLILVLVIVRTGNGKNGAQPTKGYSPTTSRINPDGKITSSLDKIEPVRGSSDTKKLSTEDASSEAMSSRLREAESLAKENANKKAPSREAVMGDVDEVNSEEHKYHAGIQELVNEDPVNPNIANIPVRPQPTQNRSLRKKPEPVEVKKKTPAEIDAEEDVKEILNGFLKMAPIVIFSKSYCPYSKKAKHFLLEMYDIEPKPYVVELDLIDHGLEIQHLIAESTQRNTVPNVIVRGRSIGGGDEIEGYHNEHRLGAKISEYCGSQCLKIVYVKGSKP